ncbi:laminin subunit beta [Acrasis kona]|uniref:Laminin subunit beta n=1 Tax=Acrasis kona TaxID=1008807 RepID=A0AAW2ZFL0_9EUKA
MINSITSWWNRLTESPTHAEQTEYKKSMLVLSQEQLQVEVETQKILENTITSFKRHLDDQKKKEEAVKELRETLIKEVEEDRLNREENELDDEVYQKKYEHTMEMLEIKIPLIQEQIRAKIQASKSRISDIAEAREVTQNTTLELAQNISEEEEQRRADGYLQDESDKIRLLEQGEQGIGILIDSPNELPTLTVPTYPQNTHVFKTTTHDDV